MTKLPIKLSFSYDRASDFTMLAFHVLGPLQHNVESKSIDRILSKSDQGYTFEYAEVCFYTEYEGIVAHIYPKDGFENKVTELILRWK